MFNFLKSFIAIQLRAGAQFCTAEWESEGNCSVLEVMPAIIGEIASLSREGEF